MKLKMSRLREIILEEKGAYKKFFKETLKKFNVSSPAELSDEKKKEFFKYIEDNWTKEKNNDKDE